jgi:hypothetical protein
MNDMPQRDVDLLPYPAHDHEVDAAGYVNHVCTGKLLLATVL